MLELKLFWKFINSVLVFSHTRIIVHCGGVRIPKQKKTLTEYTRFWKHKPNRTEIAKSKLTQPYTSAYDLLFRLALKPKFWHQPHNTDLSIGLRLDHLTSSEMKAKTVATPGLEAKTLISASSPHFDIYHLTFWPIVWSPDFGSAQPRPNFCCRLCPLRPDQYFCLGHGHGQNVNAEGIVTWPRPQDQTLALAEARMSSLSFSGFNAFRAHCQEVFYRNLSRCRHEMFKECQANNNAAQNVLNIERNDDRSDTK